MNGNGTVPLPRDDAERSSIEHDRDLAWELYDAQPTHPRIAELAQSVLSREPAFTGMINLLALHREARGEIDEARRLLQGLMGRRDRQFLNAVKSLRDLEQAEGNFAEALRLTEIVLREDPEASWLEQMELGTALAYTGQRERSIRLFDDAVGTAAQLGSEEHALALGQRATRLWATMAPPEFIVPAVEQAIEADPTDQMLGLVLGFARLYDYRPEEALAQFHALLREDPTLHMAHVGIALTRGFLTPIERGDATLEKMRELGSGEFAWKVLRDKYLGTGLKDALAALDRVMPDALAAALHAPLQLDDASQASGLDDVLEWHDGQMPGTGVLWGAEGNFRLLSHAEVAETDAAIEAAEGAFAPWASKPDYFWLIATDDEGRYLLEAMGGRLFCWSSEGPDVELAPSFADWVWDRVVAFGGRDARVGA